MSSKGRLREFCGRCSADVDQVWTADDELFARINGGPYGCLCLPCFDELARDAGVFLRWRPEDL